MKKYTFICVDGLAGNSEYTFAKFKKRQELFGHSVILTNCHGIRSMQERAKRCRALVEQHRDENIILVGFCAGAIAVNAVAKDYTNLHGVMIFSAMLPRWYNFYTKEVCRLILQILPKLITGKEILVTPEQFWLVNDPIPDERRIEAMEARIPFSGKEALQLMKGAPTPSHTCPTFHLFGNMDRQLNPKAHRKYSDYLESKYGNNVTSYGIPSGHLVLASDKTEEIFILIFSWLRSLE